MSLNMRSDFLGGSLRSAKPEARTAGSLQTQALFGLGGKKKPEKEVKKTAKSGTQKFGGALKQAQRAVQQVKIKSQYMGQKPMFGLS